MTLTLEEVDFSRIVRKYVTFVMRNGEQIRVYVRGYNGFIIGHDIKNGRTYYINPDAVAYIIVDDIVFD